MLIHWPTKIAAILLVCTCISSANADTTSVEPGVSTSIINGQVTIHESAPIQPDQNQISAERNILNFGHGLLVFDLLINLNIDNDADGHFADFSITLDIDNSFSPRDVYAIFYLSRGNGQRFEFAVTGNFTVSGTTANDSIRIETILDTGFPTDFYDLSAEIYDANTDALLVTYGPNESSHVIGIPFESRVDDRFQSFGSLSLSISGSGSFSIATLLFFALLICYRTLKSRAQRPVN